jgi:membrane protease YdiL (CAAX protease family)
VIGVLVFLFGVYASTWTLLALLGGAAAAGSSAAVIAFLFGSVWAPTVVALLVVRFIERSSSLDFLRQCFPSPLRDRWFVIAFAAPALIVGAAVIIGRHFGHAADFAPMSAWPSVVALRLATGATGEEPGWRGFLVSRLAMRYGPRRAAIASGMLWSGWHVPGLLMANSGLDAAPRLPFLLFTALFGAFLALVFVVTGGSVLASMVAHLSLNVAIGLGGAALDAQLYWWTLVAGALPIVLIAGAKAHPWRNGAIGMASARTT